MGIPRWVETNRRSYRIVDDETFIYLALIAGRVLDDITGQPLPIIFTLSSNHPNLFAKVADSGLFCLAGYVEQAFPNLDTTAYQVAINIQASGYRSALLSVPVQPGSAFPIVVPDVRLAPMPVRIQGKVTDLDGDPIPNARVVVVEEPNPPQPPAVHPLGLGTPLAADHPAGTPVHRRTLIPDGPAKALVSAAAAGSRSIRLDNRSQLAAGDVLRIGSETAGEFRRIESLPNLGDPNQPGKVTLLLPLDRSYPAASEVHRILQNPISLTTTLARDARRGDGVLLLADPLIDMTVQVGDPPAAEYHAIGALSDAQGDYRLDGISGLRTLFLLASAAGFAAMVEPVALSVNYSRPVNVMNLLLA